jgi:hypothetical protein
LSHAFSWSASAILRAGEKEQPPQQIALSRAASRFERAFKLADAAIIATDGEGFPRGHWAFLNYWRWMVRSRADALQFVVTADDRVFEAARDSWEASVRAAKAFCDIAGEHKVFPNRFFYSLTDLINEGHWLQALQAYTARNWKACTEELTLWVEQFPEKFHDSRRVFGES